MKSKTTGTIVVALIYVVAIYAGYYVLKNQPTGNNLIDLLQADITATIVVFVGSIMVKNASMYDPFWSLAPILFLVYWLELADEVSARAIIVSSLVFIWGIRLTYNWYRGWKSLKHEDWRYVNLKAKTKLFYPFVNLTGIHLFPTLLVFIAALPLQYALQSNAPLNYFDFIAIVITVVAIYFEARADKELFTFRKNTNRKKGDILKTGIWALSRHPNYFGEVLFWVGLFFFGLAAGASTWPLILGAILMLGLFLGISIPMLDKKLLASKPGYDKHIKSVPAFFPWIKRLI